MPTNCKSKTVVPVFRILQAMPGVGQIVAVTVAAEVGELQSLC